MDENLRELAEMVIQAARKMMERDGEPVQPHMIVADPETGRYDTTPVPGAFFESHESKNVLFAIAQKMADNDGFAVLLLTEMWFVRRAAKNLEEATELAKHVRDISDLPDREEAITCTVYQKGCKPILATQVYRAEESGALVFDDVVWMDGGSWVDIRQLVSEQDGGRVM